MSNVLDVRLRRPTEVQQLFIDSPAKRKVVRAGRRGGKTTGIAILAMQYFLAGRRILYTTPTQDQVDKFWMECKRALREPLEAGALYKNETRHIIEVPGTENRIRAKTAWDADSLRGDYADLLIFDEWQLTNEGAWDSVGAPMLLDNDGDAVFIYTPPSMRSRSRTKARDPRHAAKLFAKHKDDTTGRWETFHFTSFDNPHISQSAVNELAEDMTQLAYEQEIMAEDKDEDPAALWKRATINKHRVAQKDVPDLVRVVVGVDPPGGAVECGIITGGISEIGHAYILDDASLQAPPEVWASATVGAYDEHKADRILGEANYGGDMVQSTIRGIDGARHIPYKAVHATRGKAVRAEPIAARYERGLVHHVGNFPHLEDEMCSWVPGEGMRSPNRLDAMVWVLTELLLRKRPAPKQERFLR